MKKLIIAFGFTVFAFNNIFANEEQSSAAELWNRVQKNSKSNSGLSSDLFSGGGVLKNRKQAPDAPKNKSFGSPHQSGSGSNWSGPHSPSSDSDKRDSNLSTEEQQQWQAPEPMPAVRPEQIIDSLQPQKTDDLPQLPVGPLVEAEHNQKPLLEQDLKQNPEAERLTKPESQDIKEKIDSTANKQEQEQQINQQAKQGMFDWFRKYAPEVYDEYQNNREQWKELDAEEAKDKANNWFAEHPRLKERLKEVKSRLKDKLFIQKLKQNNPDFYESVKKHKNRFKGLSLKKKVALIRKILERKKLMQDSKSLQKITDLIPPYIVPEQN